MRHQSKVARTRKVSMPKNESLRDLLVAIIISLQNIEMALQPSEVEDDENEGGNYHKRKHRSEDGEGDEYE